MRRPLAQLVGDANGCCGRWAGVHCSWRVIKNVVILREWSLHTSLSQNGVRLEFPGTLLFALDRIAECLRVMLTGVCAVSS
jgi:hypothetical protein